MPRKFVKGLIKDLLPPAALAAVREVKATVSPPTTGWFTCKAGPAAFKSAATHWNGEELVRTYARRWPGYEHVRSTAVPPTFGSEIETSAFAFDPKVDQFSSEQLMRQNSILGLVYAVARAAQQKAGISMLDFGGGVGHQYGLVRALLPDLTIDCTCFDLPVSAEFGSKKFPEVRFTSSFDCLEAQYDLVVANGALQCFEDWERTAEQLRAAARNFCFVTMLPVALERPSRVVLQKWVNPDGSSYAEPEWFISREELLAGFSQKAWTLERELICGFSPQIRDDLPARADYRGFLFRRKHAPDGSSLSR